jgi:hypothetical protein
VTADDTILKRGFMSYEQAEDHPIKMSVIPTIHSRSSCARSMVRAAVSRLAMIRTLIGNAWKPTQRAKSDNLGTNPKAHRSQAIR